MQQGRALSKLGNNHVHGLSWCALLLFWREVAHQLSLWTLYKPHKLSGGHFWGDCLAEYELCWYWWCVKPVPTPSEVMLRSVSPDSCLLPWVISCGPGVLLLHCLCLCMGSTAVGAVFCLCFGLREENVMIAQNRPDLEVMGAPWHWRWRPPWEVCPQFGSSVFCDMIRGGWRFSQAHFGAFVSICFIGSYLNGWDGKLKFN